MTRQWMALALEAMSLFNLHSGVLAPGFKGGGDPFAGVIVEEMGIVSRFYDTTFSRSRASLLGI